MLHVASLLMALLMTSAAQELPKGRFPAGWHVRADGTDAAGDVAFVVMKPGWHITTGPSVILYDPSQTASGTYAITSETFLFDPGTRREAYGILLGGRDLGGPTQAYTYFVIRRTGEFLIRRRTGATTVNVRDWTSAAAIRKFDDKKADEHSVRNVLEVKVARDSTTFHVNGSEVARVPSRDIDTDGVVGLRVNHQLNIHVSSLDILK